MAGEVSSGERCCRSADSTMSWDHWRTTARRDSPVVTACKAIHAAEGLKEVTSANPMAFSCNFCMRPLSSTVIALPGTVNVDAS